MPRIFTRAILTDRRPFKFEYFEEEIRKELNIGVKQEVIKDLKGTVVGWENKPTFFARVNVTPGGVSLDVVATGRNADQYHLVVLGSPRHVITPRPGRNFLTFRPGYRSATRAGSLKSRAKLRAGPFVGARSVSHPGFVGRDFYVLVVEKNKPEFQRRIKNALQRAERRHAVSLPV